MLFALAIEWLGKLIAAVLLVVGVLLTVMLLSSAAGVWHGACALQNEQSAYSFCPGTSILGTVTQVREIRPRIHGALNHRDYQIAITYRREGETLTALFGMDTAGEPLMLTEGHRIRLRVFPYPLLETGQDAWKRAQTAAGFLPEDSLHYRNVHGVPVDETATVMFEEDYAAYETAELQACRAEKPSAAPGIMRVIAVTLGICGGALLLYLWVLL